jgi:hypothetical protein
MTRAALKAVMQSPHSKAVRNKPRMLTEREQLMLRLDLILYIRLLRLMRAGA